MVNTASRIDLLTLRLFAAVVDERSIARAAWRENITTSAISKRITDLEMALGSTLLLRHRQGIEPTEAGRALLRHCRAIVGRVDQLCAEIGEFGEGLRGLVRLSANETTAIGYLPDDIAAFLAENPAVKFDLQVETSPVVVRRVMENAADIGIFSGDEATGELRVYPYRRDRLNAVLPGGHPLARHDGAMVAFGDIVNCGLIASEAAGTIEHLVVHAAARLGQRVDTRIRVSSFPAAARLVAAGLGIAIMPEAVAKPLAASLDIVVCGIDAPWAIRELKLCVHADNDRSAANRRLVNMLTGSKSAGEN